MTRNRILPALFAGVLAFIAAGGIASAAQNGPRRGEGENAAEIAAVLGARISPAEAVAAAEHAANGRAVKLSIEDEGGVRLYEVRVAAGNRMFTVKIDPSTGAVRATEADGLVARLLDREDRSELAALQRAPTTLGQAITAAERAAGGGRAVEAAWEGEDAALGYEVEVTRDGAITRVLVDASTGQARLGDAGAHGGSR
ncbi:PepSY domain-containing protein [Roseicella aquatilis]|nr:PepSY domain-containing protein [Roseicella aquatilis]